MSIGTVNPLFNNTECAVFTTPLGGTSGARSGNSR